MPPEGPFYWLLAAYSVVSAISCFQTMKLIHSHCHLDDLLILPIVCVVWAVSCVCLVHFPHLIWLFFGFALLVFDVWPWPVSGFSLWLVDNCYYKPPAHGMSSWVCSILNVISISIMAPKFFFSCFWQTLDLDWDFVPSNLMVTIGDDKDDVVLKNDLCRIFSTMRCNKIYVQYIS